MGIRSASLLIYVITLTAAVGGAFAAVPPAEVGNLVVFPDRDFITIEGFHDYFGQDLLVEVLRGTDVTGSAYVHGTAKVLEDVAGEINHPGGACWGNGTTVQVTPDMQPGDRVRISNPIIATNVRNKGDMSFDTIIQDAFVDADAVRVGTKVTITGHIAPGVHKQQLEQRVINPDLKDTAIGRRDVRALPGLEVDNGDGYTSGIAFGEDNSFTATYNFQNVQIAELVASAGGERMMAWTVEDADGNRQGLTIAEHGELGGPGMGGCPAGPADIAPPAGQYRAVINEAKDLAAVQWTAQAAVTGSPAVTGYVVMVMSSVDSEGSEVGVVKRVPASVKSTTLAVDPKVTYTTYEVRSMSGTGDSSKYGAPFTKALAPAKGSTPNSNIGETPPQLFVGIVDGKIVLSDTEQDPTTGQPGPSYGALETYWAIGEHAIVADYNTLSSELYTGPFVPPAAFAGKEKTVCWGVFNTENTQTSSGCSAAMMLPGIVTVRTKPALVAGTPGTAQITARWTYNPAEPDLGLTGFHVQAKVATAADSTATAPIEVPPDARSVPITGLTAGTTYVFKVIPQPPTANTETAWSEPVTTASTPDSVTLSGLWRAGDYRISLSSSTNRNTIRVYSGATRAAARLVFTFSPTATTTTATTGPLTAPVSPSTLYTGSIRLRNGAAGTSNPGKVFAEWTTPTGATGQASGTVSDKRKLSLRRML